MTPDEVLDFLRDNDRFLVSSHINPDGDGLGSAMAIKWALDKMGKDARIVIMSDPPENFRFFKNFQWLEKLTPPMMEGEKYDCAVIIDAPNLERLGQTANLLADNARMLNIDHHVSNERFAQINHVITNAAASAQIVYQVIKLLDIGMDEECAEYIYTGLIVDTGRFRFSNTSPDTLKTAADLVSLGVKPAHVTEWIYFHNTIETTRALGDFLNSIQLHLAGHVATAQFSLEYISAPPWSKVDTEGFVNHALAVAGVEVAMFLREIEPGVTRASLRARFDFDVNALASRFGGGGHAKAAGCTVRKPLEEAKSALLEEAGKLMNH